MTFAYFVSSSLWNSWEIFYLQIKFSLFRKLLIDNQSLPVCMRTCRIRTTPRSSDTLSAINGSLSPLPSCNTGCKPGNKVFLVQAQMESIFVTFEYIDVEKYLIQFGNFHLFPFVLPRNHTQKNGIVKE